MMRVVAGWQSGDDDVWCRGGGAVVNVAEVMAAAAAQDGGNGGDGAAAAGEGEGRRDATIGNLKDALGTTPEGGVLLGPERPRTYEDLSDTEKKRYDADVVPPILFKMLPGENINEYYVRFHKLVNDMRNIRMTMPNIQLNSKFVNNMSPEWDRATLPQTNNQLRTSSNTQNQATIQDGRVVVQNVQGRQNQNQRYFARGNGQADMGCATE
ncbi:hypothetical protein Tco_0093497 [Tanacetum coccineum]